MNIVYSAFRGHFSDSPRAIYEALLARGRLPRRRRDPHLARRAAH